MPYFVLNNLAQVEAAINLMSTAHGAYTAVDILKDALKGVDEPPDFSEQVDGYESRRFRSHEGPTGVNRAALKAVKTAAGADPAKQDALLRLLSLVLAKLSVVKASKVLSLLLFACGFDPTLYVAVFKLCVLLAHSDKGKKIVVAAQPGLAQAIAACQNPAQLAGPLGQLAGSLGAQGRELLAALPSPATVAKQAKQKGGKALDELSGFIRNALSDDEKHGQ
jgi:hypothetical protein